MSFLRCSYCGQRCIAGVAHVYWFAPSRNGDVFRVRQRLCEDCLQANVVALLTPQEQEDLTCSACGISVDDDVFPIYLTWYVKRQGVERGAMALCEEHQLEIKVRASKDAVTLEDRMIDEPDTVVAYPSISGSATFAALGIDDPGVKHSARSYVPPTSNAYLGPLDGS